MRLAKGIGSCRIGHWSVKQAQQHFGLQDAGDGVVNSRFADLAGVEARFEYHPEGIYPRGGCTVPWREGMARMLADHHPELGISIP